MNDCSIFHYFCWWRTCNFITGTFSAYEPAIPLIALNSPTPKVVIRAAIPFMRAYPSAAYAAFNSLQFPIHFKFHVLLHHLKGKIIITRNPKYMFNSNSCSLSNKYALIVYCFQMNHLLIMQ